MRQNRFEPKPFTQEDVENCGEFMVGVLMSGLSFEEIQQAIWDKCPDYEETTIAMTKIFQGLNRLNQLRDFWGGDDE
jgi:hypothetical protein